MTTRKALVSTARTVTLPNLSPTTRVVQGLAWPGFGGFGLASKGFGPAKTQAGPRYLASGLAWPGFG